MRLELPERSHRLLRRIAADSDTSMAVYVRDMLIRHLDEEAERRGIKV